MHQNVEKTEFNKDNLTFFQKIVKCETRFIFHPIFSGYCFFGKRKKFNDLRFRNGNRCLLEKIELFQKCWFLFRIYFLTAKSVKRSKSWKWAVVTIKPKSLAYFLLHANKICSNAKKLLFIYSSKFFWLLIATFQVLAELVNFKCQKMYF